MGVIHGDVEKTHPFEIDFENRNVGAQTSGHARSIHASGTATKHDHAPRQNSRNAAEQYTRAAVVFRQIVRAHHNRHAARDFAHWFQKRQAIPDLNGLVRNTRHARVEQRFCQRLARRQVKISEKNLSSTQQRPLRRQRFLHFYDHVRALKNFLGRFDDLRPGFDVFLIRITGADASIFLHENGMAMTNQCLRGGWEQTNALLLFFNFLGNADGHGRE